MDTATTTLVSIGDNHYVDPATGLIFSQVGYRNMYGYMVMDHDGKRGVGQHRLVHEATKGPIPDGLVVNHINSVRHDNRPENLELWASRQPRGQRVSDLIEWAEEILRVYKPEPKAEVA